jgi:hypothetical protein
MMRSTRCSFPELLGWSAHVDRIARQLLGFTDMTPAARLGEHNAYSLNEAMFENT